AGQPLPAPHYPAQPPDRGKPEGGQSSLLFPAEPRPRRSARHHAPLLPDQSRPGHSDDGRNEPRGAGLMGSPLAFLTAGLASFLIGALAGLATWKRPATARVVPFACAGFGSLLLLVAGCFALARPGSVTWNLPLLTL